MIGRPPNIFLGGVPRAGNHCIAYWIMSLYPMAGRCFFENTPPPGGGSKINRGGAPGGIISGEGGTEGYIDRIFSSYSAHIPNALKVLVIRDPLNHAASYGKKESGGRRFTDIINGPKGFCEAWKNIASAALSGRWVVIPYNAWLTSPEFREDFAWSIGCRAAPPIDWVPPFAGGSSFTKTSPPDIGKLLNRHRSSPDIPHVNYMSRDAEARMLSDRIEGMFSKYGKIWGYGREAWS